MWYSTEKDVEKMKDLMAKELGCEVKVGYNVALKSPKRGGKDEKEEKKEKKKEEKEKEK